MSDDPTENTAANCVAGAAPCSALAEALQNILDNTHFTLNESAREKWERGEFNINMLRRDAEAALREYQANTEAHPPLTENER